MAFTALVVQVLKCSHCRLVYFLSIFRCLSFVSNPLFLYPWLVELQSATFPMSFFFFWQKQFSPKKKLLCVSASGLDCNVATLLLHSVRLASDKNETLSALKWVSLPLSPRSPSSSSSSSFSVRVLYPFRLSFLLLLFLLLSRLCLGMLATFELHSSMHFKLKSLFGLFFSTLLLSFFSLTFFCMMSVKMIAASINGTVSNLQEALSSWSTLDHKNLIKVSHLYSLVNGLVCIYMKSQTCFFQV